MGVCKPHCKFVLGQYEIKFILDIHNLFFENKYILKFITLYCMQRHCTDNSNHPCSSNPEINLLQKIITVFFIISFGNILFPTLTDEWLHQCTSGTERLYRIS